MSAANNKASKCTKKNVTVSAGEIDKFIIRIADFNISFFQQLLDHIYSKIDLRIYEICFFRELLVSYTTLVAYERASS